MRRGVEGFDKGRLSQALAARRLSQVQLASMVGVSPATVSKWRAGQQAPEVDALERLASVINVAPDWFTKPIPEAFPAPLFRSNASAHVAARSMLEARLEWTQDLALSLGEMVDFPSVRLPEFGFTHPDQISNAEIEIAARECRELWNLGLGPIHDLALAVEGAGVILVREETGVAQIEGVSTWSIALGRPIILLSADKDNGFRSRFDLAHELGHLVLHRYIEHVTDRERHKEMERQAHRFAGAFLLPAETFALDVRVPVALDSLLMLKQKWGVSVAAMIMRLDALCMISEDEKLGLFKRRSARWGAKAEPGDDVRPPEQPRLLRRSVELLVTSGVMPPNAIPRLVGLSPRDIEMLAGLPERYLQGMGEVVELAALRRPSESQAIVTPGTVVPFRSRSK